MKILIIHNKYGKRSGEEAVVEFQKELLISKGHEVTLFERSSEEIPGLMLGNVTAFFSGFYNCRSVRSLKKILDHEKFDVAHIHNLYPLISPAILPMIKATGQQGNKSTKHVTTSPPHHLITSPPKIVMTVHNYRLICPNGLFFTKGEICERCTHGREWNCIRYNCEKSLLKSTGYALRTWFARTKKYYTNNIDSYICLTEFQKAKLAENGFSPDKTVVIPNTMDPGPEMEHSGNRMGYAAFAGRISQEKGAHVIIEAAKILPDIPFRLAGNMDERFIRELTIPANLEFAGSLNKIEMSEFYRNAGFLVFPSIWYEGFPMVFLEAMKHRLPVIAPNMAGFPEIIEDGVNGLLFRPGDAADLAEKIRLLWGNEELCQRLGGNGFRKLQEKYSPDVYYKKLMEVYSPLRREDASK